MFRKKWPFSKHGAELCWLYINYKQQDSKGCDKWIKVVYSKCLEKGDRSQNMSSNLVDYTPTANNKT